MVKIVVVLVVMALIAMAVDAAAAKPTADDIKDKYTTRITRYVQSFQGQI